MGIIDTVIDHSEFNDKSNFNDICLGNCIASTSPIVTTSTGTCVEDGNLLSSTEFSCLVFSLKSKESFSLWHMRIGYPSSNFLINFLGLQNLPTKHAASDCAVCAIGKRKRLPHSLSITECTIHLELV